MISSQSWSYKACGNPNNGTARCVDRHPLPVLYRDIKGYWLLEIMFQREIILTSKSKSSFFPPTSSNWKSWNEDKDVLICINSKEINQEKLCLTEKTEKDDEVEYIIPVLLSLVFFAILSLTIIVIVLLMKKKETEETPKLDNNYYYGKDSDMDSVMDHRVVDMNEYYE